MVCGLFRLALGRSALCRDGGTVPVVHHLWARCHARTKPPRVAGPAPPMPEIRQAVLLRSSFASAGPGGAQIDEVAAERGVAPRPGLGLRAVVENHRAAGIPARSDARPQLVLLGGQDVA